MHLELETEHLRLREFVLDDAEFVLDLLNQPSFIRFIGDKRVRTVDDARSYITTGPIESYNRHGFGLYLVQLKESNKPIGVCGLLKRDTLDAVDLGFAFLPQFWAKGYAFEAAAVVLEHVRDVLKLTRVLAITTPDNDASIKLLERLGFQLERLMKLSSDSDEVKLFSLMLETT